jgi:predicted transposase/invertase (TIGR01784 family)
MIEFLNQVIPDRKIVDLEFLDKEMHPVERDCKGTVYDMFCRTDDGSRIIVEVQRRKQPFYPERALYYSTFQIQRQVEAGAEYYDFLPVYVVSILNFKMDDDPENKQVKSVYRIYEETTHRLLTNRVTFIFLELEKFQKKLEELDDDILEGMYFCFKNMATLDERPEVLRHRVFGKIFEVSELLNMDKVTRSKVLDKMTTERDLRNQMRYFKETTLAEGREQGIKEGREQGIKEGREQGIKEGRIEGRAEGRAERRAETVRKMLVAGVSAQVVADALGITVEECESYM